jgi:hypothetical protein
MKVDPFMTARRSEGQRAGGSADLPTLQTSNLPYVPRSVLGIQILAAWKREQSGENAWLATVIATGFQRLRAMHLSGQPAAEMLPVTAQMWVETLIDMKVNEDQDKERIETGFRYLYRTMREWPQIADLLKEMPKRVEVRRDPRDVPVRRERSEDEEAQATEALAEMQRILKGDSHAR